MKITIPAEDEMDNKEYQLQFDTDQGDGNEFVEVRIKDPDENTTFAAFISVSDLAAVVTALEKIRNDGWYREGNLH